MEYWINEFLKMLLNNAIINSLFIILLISVRKFINRRYKHITSYLWFILLVKSFIFIEIPISIKKEYKYINLYKSRIKITDLVQPNKDGLNIITILFIVWIGMVIVLGISAYIKNANIRKKLYETIINTPSKYRKIYSELCKEYNLTKYPELKTTFIPVSPMLFGYKPTIFLNDSEFEEEEVKYILRHELQHYLRKHHLYKMLFMISKIIYWFNPLIYIIYKQLDEDCELSCDQATIEGTSSEEDFMYSRTLLKNINNGLKARGYIINNFRDVKSIELRIELIEKKKDIKSNKIILFLLVILIAVSLFNIKVTSEEINSGEVNNEQAESIKNDIKEINKPKIYDDILDIDYKEAINIFSLESRAGIKSFIDFLDANHIKYENNQNENVFIIQLNDLVFEIELFDDSDIDSDIYIKQK